MCEVCRGKLGVRLFCKRHKSKGELNYCHYSQDVSAGLLLWRYFRLFRWQSITELIVSFTVPRRVNSNMLLSFSSDVLSYYYDEYILQEKKLLIQWRIAVGISHTAPPIIIIVGCSTSYCFSISLRPLSKWHTIYNYTSEHTFMTEVYHICRSNVTVSSSI